MGVIFAFEHVMDELFDLTREYFDMPVRVRLITEVQAEIELELGSREPNKTRADWPTVFPVVESL